MNLRSPLSHVLGSGSAKDGTEHWWGQRVSAVGLVILGLWFMYSMLLLGKTGFNYPDVIHWIGRTPNSVMLLLLGLTGIALRVRRTLPAVCLLLVPPIFGMLGALELTTKAVELSKGQDAQALDALARVHYELGHLAKAVPELGGSGERGRHLSRALPCRG